MNNKRKRKREIKKNPEHKKKKVMFLMFDILERYTTFLSKGNSILIGKECARNSYL
jgi:hypothetical protein